MKTMECTLECNVCHQRFPIQRRKAKRREVGHIKHLWCVRCNEKTPHTQLDNED